MGADLAKYVSFLHLLNSTFIYAAWVLLPIKYLEYYIIFLSLIIIHWFILDGHCVLTIVEYKILKKKLVKVGYESSPFLKKLFISIGYDIDESILASICYNSVFILIFISIIRLNMHKKY